MAEANVESDLTPSVDELGALGPSTECGARYDVVDGRLQAEVGSE